MVIGDIILNKDDLARATRDHWDRSQDDIDDYLRHYICEKNNRLGGKSLLEAELEWARESKCINAKQCDTLVLLVGFSLDPLLQSACVYKPNKIILILNEEGYKDGRHNEEWHNFAQYLKKGINNLKSYNFDGTKVQFLGEQVPTKPGYPTKGNPASVFKTLVEVLHDEKDVVIDITGGKKSIVAGAFMYAAYSGARISYVDFDEYDREFHRPYGFGCKIGEISNPYKEFSLHEWEQVRTLYERYQFHDAQLLLLGEDGKSGSVMAAMADFLPDSQEAIQLLVKILICYEYWDAGMYNEAAEMARDIKKCVNFEPPSAVTQLDNKWVVAEQARLKSSISNFYADTPEFKAYVFDELARISRLIRFNCDYRSAFFRAGSLNEAVMLARLVRLIDNEEEKTNTIKALQDATPGAKSLFENLQKAAGHRFEFGSSAKHGIRFNGLKNLIYIVIKDEMTWHKTLTLFGGQGNWKEFIEIRNSLVHKYYSPPRPWTEDALKFVTANVKNFWGQRISTQDQQTSALPWSELVNLTRLSDFLPPNLR